MPRARSLLVIAVAGAAAAFPAAAAAAPTIQADLPCYTQGQPIKLTGGGYTPGGPIAFLATFAATNGVVRATAVPLGAPTVGDAAGALNTTIRAPALNSNRDIRETLTITGNDQTKQAAQPPLPPTESAVSTQVQLSLWGVGISQWVNGRADPRASTLFVGVGWEPFRRIFAHYFFNGTRVRTVRIGAVTGPCGDLSKRIRQFPFRPVRAGQWTVYFSPSQVFDSQGTWIRVRVRVPKNKAVPAR